jgi:peroxin-10
MASSAASNDHVHDSPAPSSRSQTYNYPFAAAPDIIRAHQKDAYFEGIVLSHLSTLLRRIYGARFLHTHAASTRTFSSLLYLSLTTLLGNRTLGEEYCDIIQIEDDTLRLPTIARRAGYILTSILLPFSLNQVLPSFRAKLRSKLESGTRRLARQDKTDSLSFKLQSYILTHLSTLTSPSPLHAATLTIFYFTGAYYQLSKRIWGLRYIFSKRVEESEARVGYEVLGVLLVLQIVVQGWIHVRETLGLAGSNTASELASKEAMMGSSAVPNHGVEVSLNAHPSAPTHSNDLIDDSAGPTNMAYTSISRTTHTPVYPTDTYRYHLALPKTMAWIKGTQQRKCTLCLEELKDPSATQCGHVFCWSCIGDWVREKPECPLCRRACLPQHILPLRV